MRLLVFGASGKVGQELVRQALVREHSVTAFVRTPGKLKTTHPLLRVIEGDVADDDAVAAAVPGHDAVVSALGVGKPLQHDPDVVSGVQRIIRVMEANGVRRFVYLSFVGVRESRHSVGFILRHIAPIPLRHEIADHEEKEAIIRASTLDWTIVRPPTLTNGARTGTYRDGEQIASWKPVPLLSRADVADFMLQELEHPQYVRQAPRLMH
jgi:putative NADH-flavin reductase